MFVRIVCVLDLKYGIGDLIKGLDDHGHTYCIYIYVTFRKEDL